MKTFLSLPAFFPSIETLIKVVEWLLLFVLAWLLGQLLASALRELPVYSQPNLITQSHAAPLLTGQASSLFGYATKIQSAQKAIVADTQQAAKTQLNLVLQGVIVNSEQAVAIIETSAKTQVVMENDWVLPQVRLMKVMANGVLLDNRGVVEKLFLKASDQDLTQSAPVSMVSSQPLSGFDQQRLTEIGETLRKSPMSIGKFLRFQPINQKGQWVGVKIWSKNDKALFKALGFEEGDLVKQVNGRSIDAMSKNPELWKQFLTMSEFELMVDRQGEMKTLQVNFN